MGRRSRICYLCGTEYKYCPTCSQDRMKPSWMAEFHDESCMKIFDTCTRFNMGLYTKDQAKEILTTCDLSNKSTFKSYVQHDLDVIFAEDTAPKRGRRTEMKIINDEIEEIQSHEVVTKENE